MQSISKNIPTIESYQYIAKKSPSKPMSVNFDLNKIFRYPPKNFRYPKRKPAIDIQLLKQITLLIVILKLSIKN